MRPEPATRGAPIRWQIVAGSELDGFTVAVTADRRRDEQTVLLERLGAQVLMFPLLRTEPADLGALRALTETIAEAAPDYFVANTGYGMRTWLQLAAEWGLQEALVEALSSASTIVVRGAKALGEIRKVGLDAVYKAPGETLEEVVDRLGEEDLSASSVVVQLHGEPAGAVSYLPVYRMGGGGTDEAGALIDALVEGRVDVVTFTAAPQVQVLASVAEAQGRLGAVLDAFNVGGVVAACIGPVCAQGARLAGITQPLVPEHSRLGSLASALGGYLAEHSRKGGPS
jgi:uroporphyrinogen-III synthase